jgi:alpha-glucosidase
MRQRKILFYLTLSFFCATGHLFAQKNLTYLLQSPDKKISAKIEIDNKVSWSIQHMQTLVLATSPIALMLEEKEILGRNVKVSSSKTTLVDENFETPLYKKKNVRNNYNQLLLTFKGDYALEFRAFNDGAAYRFVTNKKDSITVLNEEVKINFDKDYKLYIPFVRDLREKDPLHCAFEALYDVVPVSSVPSDTLGFLPFMVELNDGKKACFLEADVENYPGMYVKSNGKNSLQSFFASYPKTERNGGFNNLNYMVTSREDYLVKTSGTRTFPWRVVVISEQDKDLANNDMVQKLATPSRIKDISWIKPGKVAWDWWNDWNISNVNFVAGVNTPTYKHYIDFASANKIEYVVLDEGWSNSADLFQLSDKINVEEIVSYGKQKNVGIILWTTWYAVQKDLNKAFDKYSKMGVKGFKIDFMDRDDAKMVTSLYKIAQTAADYKLLIDYHGMYKPTGIQRTYPNILNFEGVKGLENVKWTPDDNMPLYDVTLPFIRMMAGPMDYTPGAMRNANKANFRAVFSNPMSQGTRCHQLALYTIFEAPLQMMADNPTAYTKEQECTDFIVKIPTVFDETVSLDGKVGEYIAMARKKDNAWYIGAITNWDKRELELSLNFLGEGTFEAEIFRDGLNAGKEATDYIKEKIVITSKDKLKINLAEGGGWAAIIKKR